jgi:hypothetical protein
VKLYLERPVASRCIPIARDVALRGEVGECALEHIIVENGQSFLGRVEYINSLILEARLEAKLRRVRSNGYLRAVS